jgi:hypothetical protein
MDRTYTEQGHVVVDRQGTRLYDLLTDKESIEEKYRQFESLSHYLQTYNDFLIEDWQDFLNEFGWYHKTTASRLSYVICDMAWIPQRCYFVNWDLFKSEICPNIEKLKLFAVNNSGKLNVPSPKGIGDSRNIAIPWSSILSKYYEIYDIA